MKPVDLQIIVPRSYEVVRIQQNLKDLGQIQQSLLSSQSITHLKKARHKVIKKAKSKDVKFDTRESHKQNKDSSHKRKKRKSHRHTIDIKI